MFNIGSRRVVKSDYRGNHTGAFDHFSDLIRRPKHLLERSCRRLNSHLDSSKDADGCDVESMKGDGRKSSSGRRWTGHVLHSTPYLSRSSLRQHLSQLQYMHRSRHGKYEWKWICPIGAMSEPDHKHPTSTIWQWSTSALQAAALNLFQVVINQHHEVSSFVHSISI